MYSSDKCERVLELAKQYAKISVEVREAQLKNQQMGVLLGKRISTYSKLITHLEILDAALSRGQPRDTNVLLREDMCRD